MSTHFQKIISYLIEDIRTKDIDLTPVLAFLNDFEETFKNIEELKVSMEIVSPDLEVIDIAYQLGQIRSHEIEPLILRLLTLIKNSVVKLVDNLSYSIKNYRFSKGKVSINHKEVFIPHDQPQFLDKRADSLTLLFKTKYLTIQDVVAFTSLLRFDEFCFADSVRVSIEIKNRGNQDFEKIKQWKLEKKNLEQVGEFLTIDEKENLIELYKQPKYQQALFTYIFPFDTNERSEITIDVLRNASPPQKRRQITLKNGLSYNFHEILDIELSHNRFLELMDLNDVAGIYVSVRSVNRKILYFIIDIDVPPFIKRRFSSQLIWDCTIAIAKSIINAAARLSLPRFSINYSGNKGLHLILGIEEDAISDIESYVNIPELYYPGILPGFKTLKKNASSVIRDKFKFLKTLAQALCLFTLYSEKIAIPLEIKKALGITHQSSLFKLSFESQNLFSILLDTSSMNKGVFRLYSAHPMTRLVSIPIYNPQTNEFRKEYLNYKILREKASIVSVVEQFKKNDVDLFLLKPHKITRQQIRDLLKPDALFPSFAIILRFNSIHAVRTPYSFRFWRRFYELKIFYAFLRSIAFSFKKTERLKEVLDYVASLSRKLNIKNPKYLYILINQIFQNSINFEYYSQKLEMLYYIQFFGELKSDIFMKDHYDDLTLLFSDQFEFTYFLRQTESLFSITLHTLGDIFSSDNVNVSTTNIRVLQDLNAQIGALIKSINTYKNNREDLLIKIIHLIIFLNFVVKRFVRDFYQLKGKS